MSTLLFRNKGEQFFNIVNGVVTPLAGGLLYYYAASSTNPQATYSESTGTIVNSFPITLDAYGRLDVPVYLSSVGPYKELLTDLNGVTIAPWPFDSIPGAQLTTQSPLTGFERLYMGWTSVTSSSSPLTLLTTNAGSAYEVDASGGNVIINLPSAAVIQAGTGYTIKRTDTNTLYSVTVVPNGSDQIDGNNAAFSLPPKFAITVSSDSAQWQIAWANGTPLVMPGGRLTLTTGTPVINVDVAGATSVYYTPVSSNLVPVWSGSAWNYLPFSGDITLTLNSTVLGSSAIADVFAINNAGALAIGTGPSWSSSTPGSCSRGTGSSTTQLVRTANGLWTNAVVITLHNGATTYASIPIGQATYLGSLFGDSTSGQTSCYVTWGQSRKWGVWNAYNRRNILMQAGDPTATWNYGTATWRPSNNNAANLITTFTGLAEEPVTAQHIEWCAIFNATANIGIGVNSTTAPTGRQGQFQASGTGGSLYEEVSAWTTLAPSLGLNQLYCLEIVSAGNINFAGTQAHMLLSASYLG
jgi:hypothetical protein